LGELRNGELGTDVDDEVTVTDIVTRLRRWTHAVDAAPASDLMDEAADEIERLRLTDEEREAIKAGISACEDIVYGGATDQEAADTMRRLLDRLK
jgi:hypothetical protein